jgi:hypothetical protein
VLSNAYLDTSSVSVSVTKAGITVLQPTEIGSAICGCFTNDWGDCPATTGGSTVTSDSFDFPIPARDVAITGSTTVNVLAYDGDTLIGCDIITFSVSANVSKLQYVQNAPAKVQASLALVAVGFLAVAAAVTYKNVSGSKSAKMSENAVPLNSNQDGVQA